MEAIDTREFISLRKAARLGALAAYLPTDRRSALARSERLLDRTSGAVLFADISGFTGLTEALVDRFGPQRGAEELTRQVNGVLSDVIEEVHRFEGSVIGFAGDGVTCWFDGDDGRRAAAAALATQHRRAHVTPGEPQPLGLKLVATSGLARRFVVGHPRIQRIDVVAGGIVDRVAAAEQLAEPGEVVIGSEIVGWIRDRIDIVAWRQDEDAEGSTDRRTPAGEWFAVVAGEPEEVTVPHQPGWMPELEADVVRDWLLPPVYQRLLRGRGELVSEIRPVVTLFNDFSGIQYDLDNQAEGKLDRYVRRVQTILARYEAFLLQLVVGDKGSYFYAGFGAPLAHEDDASRALKAAAELVQLPAELTFIENTRVGISQGKMLAGAYGAGDRKTYGVLGRAANTAARLMESAPTGGILVDEEIAALSGSHFEFAPTQDGQAFELVRERPAPDVLAPRGLRQTAMVGRFEERDLLERSLERLLDGEPELLVLEGAAGIGKSRLLAALRDQAASLGIPVYVGAASAIERNTPLYAWRSIFREILGLQESSDEVSVRAAIGEHLAAEPEMAELIPLLNPVLTVDLPDTESTARMPPATRSENAIEVLLSVLRRPAAALSVGLVILDDVQWLDSASWILIEQVRSQIPSLLLALATRPPEASPDGPGPDMVAELRRLIAEAPDRHIALEPLPDDQITELVAGYLGCREPPQQLTEVVIERAEGNPLFAEELVGALEQRGLIEVNDGRCLVKATVDKLRAEFPEQIERLLTSRLDHLTMSQQTALVVASVLGRTFTAPMLRDIYPAEMGREEVDDHLEALVELGMLTLRREVPERAYEFRHGLIQQAAAELLPPSLRGEIHGRTAQWIEVHQAQNLAPWYSVLALHWDESGNVPKALEYLEAAAGHAFGSSAYDESVRLYERALALVSEQHPKDDLRMARWHLLLGEVNVHRQEEDVTSGRAHLEEGLRTIGKGPPANRFVLFAALLGQIILHLWHRLRRRHSAPTAGRRARLLEASRAYERLVEVYYITGDKTRSLHASLRALNLAEAAGPSPELARSLATVGAILGFIPMRRTADRYLSRALATVDPETEPEAAAWTSLVAAFYQAGLGNWAGSDEAEGAEPLAHRVVEISRQIGDHRRIEDGLSNLMIQAYLRGDFSSGLELAAELLEMAEARHGSRPQAYGLQGRVYCLLDLGLIEEARETVDELYEMHSSDTAFADQALIDDTSGLVALADLRSGKPRRAADQADLLMARVAKEPPSNFSSLAAYAAPAEVYLSLWREGGADRTLRRKAGRSLRLLRRYSRVFPIGRPRHLYWKALHARLRGRHDRALRLLRKSREVARSLGLRFDEAKALIEIAQFGTDPVEREDARSAADEIYRELRIAGPPEDDEGRLPGPPGLTASGARP